MRAGLAFTLLLLLAACGGGRVDPGPQPASPLAYTDPEGGDWRLVKDAASTPDKLVLALVGPAGLKTRGVALTLLVDERQVRFRPFADGAYVQSAGVFATTTTGRPDESRVLQLIVGGAQGGKLTAGVFQKDAREPAQDSGRPLFRIALQAQPGGTSGTTLPLLVRKATFVPDDLAAASHRPQAMTVTLGRLIVP